MSNKSIWNDDRLEKLMKALRENPKLLPKHVKELPDFVNDQISVSQIRSKMNQTGIKELREKDLIVSNPEDLKKKPRETELVKSEKEEKKNVNSFDSMNPEVKKKKYEGFSFAREEHIVWIRRSNKMVLYQFTKTPSTSITFTFDKSERRLYKKCTFLPSNVESTNHSLEKNNKSLFENDDFASNSNIEEITYVVITLDHDKDFEVILEENHVSCLFLIDDERFLEKKIKI